MMNVLIVHESMFGNTREVASAIADGLRRGRPVEDGDVRLVHVDDAPTVVTFDTRVHVKMLPGSAASAAAKSLRHHGFGRAERGETFWVQGTAGPIEAGELDRARKWGTELASRVTHGV